MPLSDHPNYLNVMGLLVSFLGEISSAQDAYFLANGQYFQGITSPSIEDILERRDGNNSNANVDWTVTPTDQTESWMDFAPQTFKVSTKVPFHIRLDVYEATTGWGWQLRIELWIDGYGPDDFGIDGNHWVYQHHEGAGNPGGVEDAWFIMPEDII